MTSKFVWVVIIACFATATTRAQDPTKVEPTHYHLDFENEHVQVVAVHYGPHEKSSLHEHPGGVVVNVTGGHLKFTDQNGKVQEVYAKAGEARWFPPFKHRVENVGDTPYNAVYIGMRSKASLGSSGSKAKTNDPEVARIIAEYVSRSGN